MSHLYSRRNIITTALSTIALSTLGCGMARRAKAAPPASTSPVWIVTFSSLGMRLKREQVTKVVKTDAEWSAQLDGAAYGVTRQEGTERPYSGKILEPTYRRPLSLYLL
jgi:peptide-methionine (R)-S-oxide reductase